MRLNCKKHGYLDVHIARLEHFPFCLLDQTMLDYGRLKAENAELRGINQSLSVDWVKYNDMKDALERIVKWYENEET